MKRTMRFLVWSLVCIIVISSLGFCQELQSQSKLTQINISENINNVKPMKMCDFNIELNYLPLKGDSVHLRSASLVDFSSGLLLVSDRLSCILYDLKGNVISIIGSKGQGPGEYLYVSNLRFGLDNEIIVQDRNFFLVYNRKGKFLRKFKPEANSRVDLSGVLYGWSRFNDSIFVGQVPNDTGKEKYKAVFFNRVGKTVKSIDNHVFLNIKHRYDSSFNSDASFYFLNGDFYFKEILNDTVFLVAENYEVKPVYCFTFGKYGLPKSVWELPTAQMTKEMNKYILMYSIFESSKYVFIHCNFNENSPVRRSSPVVFKDVFGNSAEDWFYSRAMLGIFDKKTKELSFTQPEKSDNKLTNNGLKNDFDGGVNFYPNFRVNDSTLGMRVDAYELKMHVASSTFKNSTPKYPEKKKELEKLANSLNENDNPVLILCTFKK